METSKCCVYCKSNFSPSRSDQLYCSRPCNQRMQAAKRKEARSSSTEGKRIARKLSNLQKSAFGFWLFNSLRRCGTVQVLQGMLSTDLIELHKLKDACSRLGGFEKGIPTGCYHLSHIYAARGSKERIGLLRPSNLIICPDWYNRSRTNFDEILEGTGASLLRSDLKPRFNCNSTTTVTELVKKIRLLLGKEFDLFLLKDQFSVGMRAQLLRLARKYQSVPESTPIDALKKIVLENHGKLYEPDTSPSSLSDVLYTEMKRWGFHEAPSYFIVEALSQLGSISSVTKATLRDGGDWDERPTHEYILDLLHQKCSPDYAWETSAFKAFELPRKYTVKKNQLELSSPIDLYCIKNKLFAAPKVREYQNDRFDYLSPPRKNGRRKTKLFSPCSMATPSTATNCHSIFQ